jgi:hypothetical protein
VRKVDERAPFKKSKPGMVVTQRRGGRFIQGQIDA